MNAVAAVALPELVLAIVQKEPAGLKHADVVREVRRRGYVHQGNDLSAVVHLILTNLVTCGAISRRENDCHERRYTTNEDTFPCYPQETCPHSSCPHHHDTACGLAIAVRG